MRIAVIGCGDIVARHLHALRQEADRVSVVACCDPDEARARKAVGECGNPEARIAADHRALVASSDIDAVDLCLPHHLHAPAAIAFAEAGKHVLCEKPLAPTVAECDAMIEAAECSGVTLMHLEPHRMSQTTAAAAALVREGRIGRLIGLQATIAYWQRAELNTGWRGDP
ncbi:MAG TPA: Gfo/Idh/MocA family oxidoreductase, partial [Chthonomonadaceae bacterium]|nr:Gfo/Idh/MocA family oxidoreductase [Chthonomonadaceae bacterium]